MIFNTFSTTCRRMASTCSKASSSSLLLCGAQNRRDWFATKTLACFSEQTRRQTTPFGASGRYDVHRTGGDAAQARLSFYFLPLTGVSFASVI